MRIKFSYVLAVAMTAAIAAWMSTGSVVIGGRAGAEGTPPPAERNAVAASTFRVRVETIAAKPRRATLEIRGRTQADALVEVRAETTGRIETRPAHEGAAVTAGDPLCVLDKGAREARRAEQAARLAQAELDFQAAEKLKASGYTAQTRVAALKAALDAARAGLREAEIELERTVIRAPVAGTIESPLAEVGAMLSAGQTCATIIATDPLRVIGQVSERDIAQLKVGMPAAVSLITGETASGTIRFISAGADPQTRTFRVETEIPNPDHRLRDGVTAVTTVELAPVPAHFVSSGILTLDDRGRVGVRSVGNDNTVAFNPVEIVGAETGGIWVTGLPQTLRVITVGQDYVEDGQVVEPVEGASS